MPRYYFAWDSELPPVEQNGKVLPDDLAASLYAEKIANEIRRSERIPQISVFNGRREVL